MNSVACIFDLDGVLVDTAKYHFLAWKRLGKELNIDFTEADNERLKGVSRMTSLEILLEIGGIELDHESKIKYAAKKNDWFVEYILSMTPNDVLPGVTEFLALLNKNNIRVALGSASKNAPTILKQIGLEKDFEVIIDGNIVSKAKPDPEVFLLGAKELNVLPEQCIVFEDAIAGIEAAHNGGMKCIGVGDSEILYMADRVVRGFQDLDLSILSFND